MIHAHIGGIELVRSKTFAMFMLGGIHYTLGKGILFAQLKIKTQKNGIWNIPLVTCVIGVH